MHDYTTRNSHTLFSWPRPPITVLSRIVDFTAPHMAYLSHSVMTRPARLNSRRDLGMVGIRNQVWPAVLYPRVPREDGETYAPGC